MRFISFPLIVRTGAVFLIALGAAAGLKPAWGCALSWDPRAPVQGTLFVVTVEDGEGLLRDVTGWAAGEPLHFFQGGDGDFRALAPAPLDRGANLSLQVFLTYRNGRVDPLYATVPVSLGSYAMERLTVAPQFAAPTDPAILERQARERERALAVSLQAQQTPRLWSEVVLPRDSRITSGFGNGRVFNGQVQSRHTGVDFAGAVGAPVHAAADGVVALVDAFHLAGNVIYINHGAGLVTGYFHLSEALVAEGDRVEAGDLIGLVGATGRVTGPHLHWLVRYGGVSVDGLSLLEAAATLDPAAAAP